MPQTLLTGNALFEAKANSKVKYKLLRSFFRFSEWDYITLPKLFHEKHSISRYLRPHVLSLYMNLGEMRALGATQTSCFHGWLPFRNGLIGFFSICTLTHIIILSSQEPCELVQNHGFQPYLSVEETVLKWWLPPCFCLNRIPGRPCVGVWHALTWSNNLTFVSLMIFPWFCLFSGSWGEFV